jgi:adenylyltransferase/sulfurtransferase
MQLDVNELKTLLDQGEPLALVDVREQDEWQIARLPGARLIPLSEFAQRGPSELDSAEKIVLYCHHGMRSENARQFLLSRGFANVWNLSGGIDAWSVNVDSSLPRY